MRGQMGENFPVMHSTHKSAMNQPLKLYTDIFYTQIHTVHVPIVTTNVQP